MNRKSILITFALLLSPAAAFAANMTLKDLLGEAATYLNLGLRLLMGLAVLMFVWYVIQYFIRADHKDRAEAGWYILWSLVGFFVILSMWGLVNILVHTLNLGNTGPSWSDINNLVPK